MTGLDKMINQILEEANNSASAKIEEAKAQAEEVLKQAKAENAKEAESILQKSKAEQARRQERASSSADLKKRMALLKAKQEIISQIINKAYEKFCSQSEADYFATLLEILKKCAVNQKGILYFSSEDLRRLPAGYEEKVQKVAKKKGGSLSISSESRNIDKGFILAYDGIEENCSFRELFDSKRDELQDKVQAILFS